MEYREALSFDDVLLVPRYSDLNSRSDANISTFGFSNPIGMTPMDTVTSVDMIELFLNKNMLASVHRYFKTPQEQYEYLSSLERAKLNKVYFAVGSVHKYKDWIDWLWERGIRRFIVDMAHGESTLCVDTVKYIKNLSNYAIVKGYTQDGKQLIPDELVNIIAGNVVTKSGFNRLQEAGANGIRTGVGSGSICSTRINTAFGMPQLSAIMDCARVKNDDVMLIACGGIKNSGDIVKAMAVGADMCFTGKLLASTDLALGQCYDKNREMTCDEKEVVYKHYRGMASREARNGVMAYASVEGVAGLVKYMGSTEGFISDTELNLKSALSYGGSRNWGDFRKKVKMVKISNSSINESQTHVL